MSGSKAAVVADLAMHNKSRKSSRRRRSNTSPPKVRSESEVAARQTRHSKIEQLIAVSQARRRQLRANLAALTNLLLKNLQLAATAERMRITTKPPSRPFSQNQKLFGEVGASIVDELSQPLSAILSNLGAASNFLWAGPLELRKILADVRADTLRACEIVREVRELFAGRITRKAFVQINSIVENLLNRLSAQARHCHTALMADLAAELPEVYVDAAEIEQAIANLIWNGIEAMADRRARERTLVIGTRLCENVVEISVSDNGAGISPDALPRLFETYFTTKPDRMGLGLAVARSIAELHQGTITAENNRGKGATFRLRLPLRHGHKTATPQHSCGVLKYGRQG